MFLRPLDKKNWQVFFNALSKELSQQHQQVEIEVASLEIGDQVMDEWIPLNGMSYDAKSDVFYVHTASLEHAIRHPLNILVEGDALTVHRIDVQTADGTSQTIRLRKPLALEGAGVDSTGVA